MHLHIRTHVPVQKHAYVNTKYVKTYTCIRIIICLINVLCTSKYVPDFVNIVLWTSGPGLYRFQNPALDTSYSLLCVKLNKQIIGMKLIMFLCNIYIETVIYTYLYRRVSICGTAVIK